MKEIPDWLKKSAPIVQTRDVEREKAKQLNEKKLFARDQQEEAKRQLDIDRLEKEGLWALSMWKELDLDSVANGILSLFERAWPTTSLRIDRPKIKFIGPSKDTTFESNDYLHKNKPYRPLNAFIDSFLRHGAGSNTTYFQGDRLNQTHFENITQKISRVWYTTEGHSGEGEHSYQQEHSEDFFVLRLQNEGVFISMPNGKKDHPFIKILSFDSEPTADKLKASVDEFVSNFV